MALVGISTPRLFTEPLRPLNRSTSRGFSCIDFARDVLQEPLMPWQEEAVIRALELKPDGKFRFDTVLIIVGRQSGKTHLLKTLILWRMFMDEGCRLAVSTAQDLATAKEVWTKAVETCQSSPELAAEVKTVRYANGEQTLQLVNGSRYIIRAATRSAGRGLSVDVLHVDELREHQSWDSWSALQPTTLARPNSITFVTSNAGDDTSVVLNKLRQDGIAGATDPDTGTCLLEWSAPDRCDIDDVTAWAQSCPALGYQVSEEKIRAEMGRWPPAKFRTEYLCQWVSTLNEAIDMNAWLDCADPVGTMDSVRSRVVAGVDVAPDGAHVSLVVAAAVETGVRVEVAGAWANTADARRQLPDLLSRIKPRAVAWYPSGPAAALGALLRSYRPIELSGVKVSEACQQFADLVASRRLVHNSDPLLGSQISQASKLPSGDGWRFSRKHGIGHVDCLYAAAAATSVVLNQASHSIGKPRLLVAA